MSAVALMSFCDGEDYTGGGKHNDRDRDDADCHTRGSQALTVLLSGLSIVLGIHCLLAGVGLTGVGGLIAGRSVHIVFIVGWNLHIIVGLVVVIL